MLLNLFLPPRCLACGTLVDSTGGICAECWRGISFLAPPHCACCGYPFDHDTGPDVLCGACMADPPLFDRARAVVRYDDGSRGLVISFKHRDRTDAAPAFAKWMARAGEEFWPDADLIVPVPLHRTRLISRRFNQSAMLALGLHRETGIPAVPDALIRVRRTPPQGALNARQRSENVRGAFRVHPVREAVLREARVVLVDDVYTTGATAAACVRALQSAGVAGVDVLTLARVVRPERV